MSSWLFIWLRIFKNACFLQNFDLYEYTDVQLVTMVKSLWKCLLSKDPLDRGPIEKLFWWQFITGQADSPWWGNHMYLFLVLRMYVWVSLHLKLWGGGDFFSFWGRTVEGTKIFWNFFWWGTDPAFHFVLYGKSLGENSSMLMLLKAPLMIFLMSLSNIVRYADDISIWASDL